MKRKQFVKGMNQIAQEGAIQIFFEPGGGMERVIVGVVGVLQFEVLEYRLKNEYGVDVRRSNLSYQHIRWIENEDIDLEGIDMIRKYLREYTLNARPLCENSMGAVSDMGKLFQGYVLGQCEEDSFFEQAQNCINTYY